jgi:hypothetical protein
MTMHLVIGLTSNRNQKIQTKMTEKKQIELNNINRERRRAGLPELKDFSAPASFRAEKSRDTYKGPARTVIRAGADHRSIPSKDTGIGNAFKAPIPEYTGKNMLGIAVQHKSCLQPIFSEQAARDSASMRR